MRTPLGPFRTYEQLVEAAAPLREAMSAINASDHLAKEIRTRRHEARIVFITDALTEAGVELGELDTRCVSWLAAVADHEEVIAVTDWLLRAHVAGQDAPREDEAEQPVISWVLYRPQPGSEILEPAGFDGDVSFTLDVGELAVDKLVEYATGAWDWVVKVYGTRGQLSAWAQWENGEAVAYRNGDA